VVNWDGVLKSGSKLDDDHVTHLWNWIERLIARKSVWKFSYANDTIEYITKLGCEKYFHMITCGQKVDVTKTFELFLINGSYNRRHAYGLKKVPWK
jgi:hypothetical protein